MLLCECVESSSDFASPSAVATQTCSTYFATGVMFAVGPIHFEPTVIVHVNHLMDHRIFLMFFRKESILAQ
jgi:hypothetical protein